MGINKKEARIQIRAEKKKMTPEVIDDKSKCIMERINQLDAFICADTILTYVNYNQEVETMGLISDCLQKGKHVLVPKVCGDVMHFYEIHSLDALAPGCMGILEPTSGRISDVDAGFMVMPGLAFDKTCARIGYGGGYYDKYLTEHPYIYKAAVAFDFQILEDLEVEAFDIRPDVIVTEKQIIKNEMSGKNGKS